MRSSIVEARNELLGIVDTIVGVEVLTDPAKPVMGPVVDVSVNGWRTTATEWYVPVRLYVPASLPSAVDAQNRVLDLADELDTAFRVAGFEVTTQVAYAQSSNQQDVWSVESVVTVYREDFSR